ncbi:MULTISPECIES: hypothetical protein [Clostridium]|uniref:Transposase n=3 Tax=Clostridium TaxID=1485 RepID=D8GSD9_CLOLD|nr:MULTISPECIES: hypothetical protein [Clostridium]ADK16521.1 hypothetical protein CLJU_c34800 [Clostridium ljungdahlii DSM 13528]AGY75602.1 hypothetical protein CAETHG_1377 [Clostridium autoethanogenum DSM 10061]ALU35765.1 Hypothetical protein CLAU_1336 [Clostridium autoethanogenum DSM 10061]OAA89610.1 hypothetical protein WX45_01442 [Clostridium ljungdahlii DSM 13528]OVY52173.1 hypothetical protein WX72_01065 [Clostridium autoethanogenum]
MGMHIVVLLCSNGWFKLTVCFRMWIPKQKCEDYHIKLELAIDMITFAHKFGLQVEYATFDTGYSSKDCKSKQVNDITSPIVTTIWDKLSG